MNSLHASIIPATGPKPPAPSSQFEQHIRAIAGWPLADGARHSDCVMENLIGDEVARIPVLAGEPGVLVHDYGKAESRPGRKMGHFTRIAGRIG